MSSALNARTTHGVALNTTDATQTVAATIQTYSDRAYQVTARVLATETTDHDEIGSYVMVAAFKNDGGTLAQVGATTAVSTIESTGGWAVDFAVSGTVIQIKVTGAAATNITWLIDTDVQDIGSYIPNGGILGGSA